jgi:hypothetical protein
MTSAHAFSGAATKAETTKQVLDEKAFDYGAPAELFPRRSNGNRGQIGYKRFDTAAEAIRFTVEEVHTPQWLSVCLQVKEARFELREIRDLYDNAAYPLRRREKKSASNKRVRPVC